MTIGNQRIALANLPGGASETPGYLLLETSFSANILDDAWPLSLLAEVVLPPSLWFSKGVQGAGDKIVLILVSGREKGLPWLYIIVTWPSEICSKPPARLGSLICRSYGNRKDI